MGINDRIKSFKNLSDEDFKPDLFNQPKVFDKELAENPSFKN